MKEKADFIKTWQSGDYTVTELCNAFNISRTTGHKLIKKFKKNGIKCFYTKNKKPLSCPHKTPPNVEKAIVNFKLKHKNWGAKKIKILLSEKFKQQLIPSVTTINNILNRNNLVKKRKKRPYRIIKTNPKFDPPTCNEIWSADYKGKFRLGNSRYCYTLTICDSKSRFLLAAKAHYRPNFDAVKAEYIRVFKEFGMPQYLHTDNGSPFGSMQSVQRFSKICYWLIDLGIHPVFSDPGCPQQNGRHERMHKDLKAECANPPASTLRKQQVLLDQFIYNYNNIRPHEALNMITPFKAHKTSNKQFPSKIVPYDYPYDFKVLKVSKNGSIRWGAYHWVFISGAATKRYVGVKEVDNGIWKVYYRDVFLGIFDTKKINTKEQYLKLSNIIV